MSELTIFPARLHELTIGQLADLPHNQFLEVDINLDQLTDWVKKARTKLDAAKEQRFGNAARNELHNAGQDFGTTYLVEGSLRVKFELPKSVSWDQKQLAAIAARIASGGEKVSDYMDVDYSVTETRFKNWPPTLQEQFAQARTVKPGKATFRLSLNQDEGI